MTDIVAEKRKGKGPGNQYFENRRHIALILTGWLGFQIIAIILELFIASILGGTDFLNNSSINMLLNCGTYGILIVCLLAIYGYTNIGNLIKKFRFLRTYIAAAVCVISIIAFNNIYSIVLNLIKTPVVDNINETNVVDLTTAYPAASIIFFGIIGPICEELTYRVGLFSLCNKKSRVLAYVISTIVFAFIHFNFDAFLSENFNASLVINELLNLPFYLYAGFAFSYLYDHYGFESSVSAHITNNLISLLVSIFAR